MEKRGVPSVTIVGAPFVVIARFESEALGLPALPMAVVEYPMGGVPRREATARAERAFDQIVGALLFAGGEA